VTAAHWAVGVMLAIFAVVILRFGARQWWNVGRPLSHWLLMDAESRAGYDCGSLALGIKIGTRH